MKYTPRHGECIFFCENIDIRAFLWYNMHIMENKTRRNGVNESMGTTMVMKELHKKQRERRDSEKQTSLDIHVSTDDFGCHDVEIAIDQLDDLESARQESIQELRDFFDKELATPPTSKFHASLSPNEILDAVAEGIMDPHEAAFAMRCATHPSERMKDLVQGLQKASTVKLTLIRQFRNVLSQAFTEEECNDILEYWICAENEDVHSRTLEIVEQLSDFKNTQHLLHHSYNFLQKKQWQQVCSGAMPSIFEDNENTLTLVERSCTNHDALAALGFPASTPTHRLRASENTLRALNPMNNAGQMNQHYIPADILFDGKVQFMDLEIDMSPDGKECPPARVCIRSDYKERMLDMNIDGEIVPIGFLSVPLFGHERAGLLFNIGTLVGFNALCIDMEIIVYGAPTSKPEGWSDFSKWTESIMLNTCSTLLQYWYDIQVAANYMPQLFEPMSKIKDRRKYLIGDKQDKLVRSMRICKLDEAAVVDAVESSGMKMRQNGYWEDEEFYHLHWNVGSWPTDKSEDDN